MILGKKQAGDAAGGWTFFTAPFLQVLNSLDLTPKHPRRTSFFAITLI